MDRLTIHLKRNTLHHIVAVVIDMLGIRSAIHVWSVFMRLQRFAGQNATGKGGLSLVIIHFQKLAFKTRCGKNGYVAPGITFNNVKRSLHFDDNTRWPIIFPYSRQPHRCTACRSQVTRKLCRLPISVLPLHAFNHSLKRAIRAAPGPSGPCSTMSWQSNRKGGRPSASGQSGICQC